jgi:hypothetical protein
MLMRATWFVLVSLVGLLLATHHNEAAGLTPQANDARDVKADTGSPDVAKGRLMNLDAKPEAIAFDPEKTALIVVDMQNDFGSKGGMFDRAGIDISGIQDRRGPHGGPAHPHDDCLSPDGVSPRPVGPGSAGRPEPVRHRSCSAWGRRSRRRTSRMGAC